MLRRMQALMEAHFGHTAWWPGDTPFEIAVGAILTQNTSWTNVERAIAKLKAADMLSPRGILEAQPGQLEDKLKSSGYFNIKAKRLRAFCQYLLDGYGGQMERLAAQPLETLRPELLGVYGIGPETADDILLYACEKPVFVVDAYTRRILHRHSLCDENIAYEDLRATFEHHLTPDVAAWKEYHALLVYTGKHYCRPRDPKCSECPLGELLP